MGSFIAFREIMQYMGNKLDQKTIGLVLSNLPFIPNSKAIMASMLVNENRANDIILALDRGENVQVHKYENHDIVLQALSERMVKSDYLAKVKENPQIEEMYMQQIQQREQIKQEQLEAIRQANQGDIPMSGDLVRIQIWQQVPNADGTGTKNETLMLPVDSIEWLKTQLLEQNKMKEVLSELPNEMQANILNNKGVSVNV
jgi:hypothetical protein